MPFCVEQAQFPCALLDENYKIARVSALAQCYALPADFFSRLLNESQRLSLSQGEGISLSNLPDGRHWIFVPMPEGILAVCTSEGELPHQAMTKNLIWKMQGLFCILPSLEHFLEDNSKADTTRQYLLYQCYDMMRTMVNLQWER